MFKFKNSVVRFQTIKDYSRKIRFVLRIIKESFNNNII